MAYGETTSPEVEAIATQVVDAAFRVHTEIGPGLLESVYEECLCVEFQLRNIPFERQVPIKLTYRGVTLQKEYKADLIVANLVVVEIKAVEAIDAVHPVQLRTYLRIFSLPLGILINFNTPLIKDGIKRVLPHKLK